MNSSSKDNEQLRIFDVEGVDQELFPDMITIKTGDFNFDDWADTITLDMSIPSYDIAIDPNDADVTITKHGEQIKVGDTLLSIEDKLDAIISKVEMIEQALLDNPEVEAQLKDLPSINTLVEQKQMINTIKRSGNNN